MPVYKVQNCLVCHWYKSTCMLHYTAIFAIFSILLPQHLWSWVEVETDWLILTSYYHQPQFKVCFVCLMSFCLFKNDKVVFLNVYAVLFWPTLCKWVWTTQNVIGQEKPAPSTFWALSWVWQARPPFRPCPCSTIQLLKASPSMGRNCGCFNKD